MVCTPSLASDDLTNLWLVPLSKDSSSSSLLSRSLDFMKGNRRLKEIFCLVWWRFSATLLLVKWSYDAYLLARSDLYRYFSPSVLYDSQPAEQLPFLENLILEVGIVSNNQDIHSVLVIILDAFL